MAGYISQNKHQSWNCSQQILLVTFVQKPRDRSEEKNVSEHLIDFDCWHLKPTEQNSIQLKFNAW